MTILLIYAIYRGSILVKQFSCPTVLNLSIGNEVQENWSYTRWGLTALNHGLMTELCDSEARNYFPRKKL